MLTAAACCKGRKQIYLTHCLAAIKLSAAPFTLLDGTKEGFLIS